MTKREELNKVIDDLLDALDWWSRYPGVVDLIDQVISEATSVGGLPGDLAPEEVIQRIEREVGERNPPIMTIRDDCDRDIWILLDDRKVLMAMIRDMALDGKLEAYRAAYRAGFEDAKPQAVVIASRAGNISYVYKAISNLEPHGGTS